MMSSFSFVFYLILAFIFNLDFLVVAPVSA